MAVQQARGLGVPARLAGRRFRDAALARDLRLPYRPAAVAFPCRRCYGVADCARHGRYPLDHGGARQAHGGPALRIISRILVASERIYDRIRRRGAGGLSASVAGCARANRSRCSRCSIVSQAWLLEDGFGGSDSCFGNGISAPPEFGLSEADP